MGKFTGLRARCAVVGWVLMGVLFLSACSDEDEVTRVAVENSAAESVSVQIVAQSGETVTFSAVSPGMTSAYQQVDFGDLAGVAVTVTGSAMGGTVTLGASADNTIVLSEDAPPALRKNESSAGTAGNGGGW